jgi:hypothetical protein
MASNYAEIGFCGRKAVKSAILSFQKFSIYIVGYAKENMVIVRGKLPTLYSSVNLPELSSSK